MKKRKEQITLDEAKTIQIEILDELNRYCKKNNINYFIIAGTLLGAVRHKGYIPWDDDIDVVMLRNDYERFMKEYDSCQYYIASSDRLNGYSLPFIKLCKKDTLTLEFPKIMSCELGINIDIFPVDNVPDSGSEQDKLLRVNDKYKYWLGLKWGVPTKRSSKIINVARKAIALLLKGTSYATIVKKMNQNASQYNMIKTRQCSEVIWGCGKKEFVNTAVFHESIDIEFEGKNYKAPIGWEEWLGNRYGDFMKLPPKELQIAHHNRTDYLLTPH